MSASDPSFDDKCPEHQLLTAWIRGEVHGQLLTLVSEHVTCCVVCETRVSAIAVQLTDDDLDARLRACFCATNDTAEFDSDQDSHANLEFVCTDAGIGKGSARTPTDYVPSVDKYRLLEVIGRGGMGVVYRAVQPPLNRPVAIKTIRRPIIGMSDASQMTRFRTEAEAVSRLDHPNLVRLYDFGDQGDEPYMVFEYVSGGTLASRFKTERPDPLAAAGLVGLIARAVGYAHRQRVLHRDLKPSNVLMTSDGVPKVTDFGLAKLLDELDPDVTVANTVLGTPTYMSPEQAAGRLDKIGPASDVWAVGVILYELLTGRVPFNGSDRDETLNLVQTARVNPPSTLVAGLPRDLERVCLTCLDRDPAARYQSADHLADDLARVAAGQRPVHLPRPAGRIWRRVRRPAAIAGLCLGLCLPVGAMIYPRDPDRTLRQTIAELRQNQEVTLIGETGSPKWSKWQVGADDSRTEISSKGEFTVTSFKDGMLELLPDPQFDKYQITAEIKHVSGDRMASVGLYIADTTRLTGEGETHHLAVLKYDDLNTPPEVRVVPPGGRPWTIPPVHRAEIGTMILTDPGLGLQFNAGTAAALNGPEYSPDGAGQSDWRTLTVTAERDGVRAEWDGIPLVDGQNGSPLLTGAEMDREAARCVKEFQQKGVDNLLVKQLNFGYDNRGALGIWISHGTAMVRSVRLVKLP